MSGATTASPQPKAAEATAVAEVTIEGLQWMLLRAGINIIGGLEDGDALCEAIARGAECDVWLNAYDAAPEAVRQSLNDSVTAGSAWAPAVQAVLTAADIGAADALFGTPLTVFVTATDAGASPSAVLSDAAVARLFRVLQRVGLFGRVERRELAEALHHSASDSARAFQLRIADPNADAALPGPTRCSAGDAHNPPRHHSVRCDDEATVFDVLYHTALGVSARGPAVWRAFTDARRPSGARAMAEEWAHELTGPCGCEGRERVRPTSPLLDAIQSGSDKAGEWLAARLPPKRLNEPDTYGFTPLLVALRSNKALPRTVVALLSRVLDADLTVCVMTYTGEGVYTAAEWIARFPPQWLSADLAAEVKLKAQQFGPARRYLPSAAVLCVQSLQSHQSRQSRQSHESVGSGVSLPRELVRLVLQYTALPQPNP